MRKPGQAGYFISMDWDPHFIERSPMLEPLRAHAIALQRHCDWPSLSSLQRLVTAKNITTAGGAPLNLVSETNDDSYEARIRVRAEMHVRERDWHDLFNVLVWLAYPLAKAALNDAQFAAWRDEKARVGGSRLTRGPVRDALTLFDEGGLIVLASDGSLLDDLREFRWKRLFCERRQEVLTSMRFFVFGHALCEKALCPYIGMTAHALLFAVAEAELRQPLTTAVRTADTMASAAIASIVAPRSLSPVPVLGIPGWWAENESPAFYDNTDYFRTGRRQRQG
jgi:hypothetical protein